MDDSGFIEEKDYAKYGLDKPMDFRDICWSSDWNGDEVGFDDIDVVGLYSLKDRSVYFYLDISNGNVLEAWLEEEEE